MVRHLDLGYLTISSCDSVAALVAFYSVVLVANLHASRA